MCTSDRSENSVRPALQSLHAEGLSILLVEQNAHRALAATQRAYVLDQGSVVYQGRSDDLARDDQIIAHYLGEQLSDEQRRPRQRKPEPGKADATTTSIGSEP